MCLHHRAVRTGSQRRSIMRVGGQRGPDPGRHADGPLGLSALIERWVRTGSANPGPKICTVVAAMLAGATHIDHVGMLRAGRTGRVLGFRPMAPSTVGSFLRTFTFGHVRQLEAVLSRTLARAWGLGAGPGDEPLVVDVDSTICEVHGKQKQGAAYGYTSVLGYHPLLAARADTREVLGARMRKGSAGSSRGVVRFVDELVANLRRAGAAGPTTVRGDSGFWSWKLIDRLDAHDIKWSITVALIPAVRAAIQAIPAHRMDRHTPKTATPKSPKPNTPPAAANRNAPSASSCAAPASPTPPNNDLNPWFPTGDSPRRVGVVRRLAGHAVASSPPRIDGHLHAQHRPRHRRRRRVPPRPRRRRARHPRPQRRHRTRAKRPLRPLRRELRTARRGAVLAHNIGHWTTTRAPTRRRPRTAPAAPDSSPSRCAVAVNRSGTPTLRYPARWPWETQFRATLTGLCPDPPAKQHSPELTPPHKPSVDNPKPHPHP